MRERRRSAGCLLRPPRSDAPARIFCFPYAGVGASSYAQWPERVGVAELCLLQPPARENRLREPHFGTYDVLAEQITDSILPHLDRTFAFFGHCGGSLPGITTAMLLADRGLPVPDRVFVSSFVPPHQAPYGSFLRMNDEELLGELRTIARTLGAEPHPDLLALSLRVLRADVEAHRRYRFTGPAHLPFALTLIGWDEDEEIPAELMTGWAEYADPADLRFVRLPGSHYSYLSAPQALMDVLADDMAAAMRTAAAS
jgi:surfactin synthase thioesterase subunit